MTNFRITGPGLYVNRRGEKIEIVSFDDLAGFWFDSNKYRYMSDGASRRVDSFNIVGVWEESLRAARLQPFIDAVQAREQLKKQTPSYDLTRVSERFRALENGRRLKNQYGTIVDEVAESSAYRLVDPEYTWSLVPETRRVVTRLWVYTDYYSDTWVQRSEYEEAALAETSTCLGAIEGSEQTEEVPVD